MKTVYAVIGLRSAALAALLAGKVALSDRLYAVADLVEAGKATDDHMQAVADKLAKRDLTEADFDDVMSRINDDYNRLQNA